MNYNWSTNCIGHINYKSMNFKSQILKIILYMINYERDYEKLKSHLKVMFLKDRMEVWAICHHIVLHCFKINLSFTYVLH